VFHLSRAPTPAQPVARKRRAGLGVDAAEEERMMLELSPEACEFGIFQGEHSFVFDERLPVVEVAGADERKDSFDFLGRHMAQKVAFRQQLDHLLRIFLVAS
jgi:hypothetical protein